MQISQPMKDIKTAYVKLKKEWRNLLPHERLALFHVMTASWTILHNSTQALCEVSGYQFEKRLEGAEEKVAAEYRSRIKNLRDGNPSRKRETIGFLKELYAMDRTMAFVQEAERALYRTGVLLS